MTPGENPLADIAITKLSKMLGEPKGAETFRGALAGLGLARIETPDHLKQLANHLIGLGGLSKMIGHSLMVEALLRGAQP
ncbi:MAG: hypothetical protein JST54_21995 [Deltaproteobacteria bacterium]|nr:hypothetical protein [Deltaproteobacteria bacterium]